MTSSSPRSGAGDPGYAGRGAYRPLFAAGFITAFGAHSIAANLGVYSHEQQASLLTVGLLLAVYDIAEVVLKPVFGALTDRIGPRPVLMGGLIGFAVASAAFVLAGDPALLGVARLGQGMAAAAFSPAASTLVARLSPDTRQGRVFGTYGAWKGLGYTLGPLIGGVLISVGGYVLLFATLAALAVIVALWSLAAVPTVAPLPRQRSTVVDLTRRLTRRSFLAPTLALAAATAGLAAAVGFLPLVGAADGMTALQTGALISALSAAAALAQPWAGRAYDNGRLSGRFVVGLGLSLTAAGFVLAATVPGWPALTAAVLAIGIGTGIATPVAFATLSRTSPPERLGETMGAAEVGRELGDAGGPLLVGVVAGTALAAGLVGLAVAITLAAIIVAVLQPATPTAVDASDRGTPDDKAR